MKLFAFNHSISLIMKVSIDISYYLLKVEYKPPIKDFIARLNQN